MDMWAVLAGERQASGFRLRKGDATGLAKVFGAGEQEEQG